MGGCVSGEVWDRPGLEAELRRLDPDLPRAAESQPGVISLEGTNFFFNSDPPEDLKQLLGKLTDDEFRSVVKRVNKEVIDGMIGAPVAPSEKQLPNYLERAHKAALRGVTANNHLWTNRGISFELTVSTKPGQEHKSTFSILLLANIPRINSEV